MNFVGFTLQYELSYTNILNMLDLGRIPVKQRNVQKKILLLLLADPAYISGTSGRFFDLAVVGEGEEVMVELMELIKMET